MTTMLPSDKVESLSRQGLLLTAALRSTLSQCVQLTAEAVEPSADDVEVEGRTDSRSKAAFASLEGIFRQLQTGTLRELRHVTAELSNGRPPPNANLVRMVNDPMHAAQYDATGYTTLIHALARAEEHTSFIKFFTHSNPTRNVLHVNRPPLLPPSASHPKESDNLKAIVLRCIAELTQTPKNKLPHCRIGDQRELETTENGRLPLVINVGDVVATEGQRGGEIHQSHFRVLLLIHMRDGCISVEHVNVKATHEMMKDWKGNLRPLHPSSYTIFSRLSTVLQSHALVHAIPSPSTEHTAPAMWRELTRMLLVLEAYHGMLESKCSVCDRVLCPVDALPPLLLRLERGLPFVTPARSFSFKHINCSS